MTGSDNDVIPCADRPFVVGKMATLLSTPPETLSDAFAASAALICRDVLDPDLLDRIRLRLDDAHFVSQSFPGVGARESEAQPVVNTLCCTVLQRPPFLRWLEKLVGTPRLETVRGGIGQTWPAERFHLDWHSDMPPGEEGRRLAITIDLSSNAFEGGMFELRRRSDGHTVRFRHDRPGSALVFKVGDAFEHRLLPITDGGPRRVFAGWFYAPER